jgi:hypothetical protein
MGVSRPFASGLTSATRQAVEPIHGKRLFLAQAPPAAIQPVTIATAKNIRFELASAVATGNIVTVTIFATNEGIDRVLYINPTGCCAGWRVQIIDDLGNTYFGNEYTVGNQRNQSDIVNGVRTRITVRFTNMPTEGGELQAKVIRRLTSIFSVGQPTPDGDSTIEFRLIPIAKNQK